MENDTTFIGNYRIRYRGEPMVVPVDEQGKLHLPDGKTVQLSEEQFKLVKDKIEASREREAKAKPLMMPTQTEMAAIYQGENSSDKKPEDSQTSPEGVGAMTENPAEPKVNREKEKKAAEKAKAKAEKKAEQEREKERKKAEKEAAIKQAEEKRQEKEKLREAKKDKSSEVGRLSLIVTALVSILITLVVMGGLFFYCVNSGFITINNSPRLNGFVIYDDAQQETATGSNAVSSTAQYIQQ